MRRAFRWATAFPVALLTLSACSDGRTVTDPVLPDPSLGRITSFRTADGGLQGRLDVLAQAIADAASDAAVRAELVGAFRASEEPEGKLYLAEAVAPGRVTGQRLEARYGPVGGLSGALRDLPDLDFYVARGQDRGRLDVSRTNIAVIGIVDPDQGYGTAYFSDGRSELVLDPDAVEADVLIAIHPTERKRGGIALARSTYARPPIVIAQDCEPDGDDCGGGGGSPYAITRVGQFEVNFSDWIGTAEVEFRGEAFCGTGYQGDGVYRREGVEMYVTYAGGTLISNWAPSVCGSNGSVEVGLYETDPFGADDYYGSATWYVNQSGAGKYFVFYDPNGYATVNWVYVPG